MYPTRGRRQPLTRTAWTVKWLGTVPCLLLTITYVSLSGAQPREHHPAARGRTYDRWYWYNPRATLSVYIYAQADLMRAQGKRAVDFAEARVLLAQAVDKELDNWLEYMEKYWQRKIDYEKNRIKLNQLRQVAKDQRLNDRRAMKSRIWERIKNNPELNGQAVENGSGLNFLLDRLANAVGTYDIGRLEGVAGPEDYVQLRLTPDQLHALQLYQAGVHGGRLVFRADGSSNIDLDWWPFKLRGEEFNAEREAYMKARRAVIEQAESGSAVDEKKLQALRIAFGELSKKFYERYVAQEEALFGGEAYRQYYGARAFIHALGSELHRLENTGDARVLKVIKGFGLEEESRDVLGLLAFMNRNGIRFAPAQPGDEYAYHVVFKMMRDIYVTMAAYDEAIQPRDPTEQLN